MKVNATPNTAHQIQEQLAAAADPEKAAFLPRFFKSGPGQYGEGDQFIGVTVPDQRRVAKHWAKLATLDDVAELLASPIHEHRLTGLMILTYQFPKASPAQQLAIVEFYLSHTHQVNNWDLVDTSAHHLLGSYLVSHPDQISILDTLANSKLLWDNRIAMIATYAFIKVGQLQPALDQATKLLHHPHDLMHKAVGWMLREVGKQDEAVLKQFLEQHFRTMPRTALRYAIEKLTPTQRNYYLGRS